MKESWHLIIEEMKMQQTKSYWRLLAVTGVVSAFIASACVVTTDDDDGSAGAGGSGTAGASAGAPAAGTGTAGTGTAGTGTAGSPAGGAGSTPFQCDTGESGAPGTPNSCVPSDSSDPCQKCIQDSCCDLYEFCYATDPGNQCGWGGPATLPDGTKNDGAEIL